MERTGEVTAARVPGEHGLLLAGRAGDRTGPGVVLPPPGVGIAVRVVPEPGEHPGTEDLARARLGQE
jgi:hypothetical protein